MKRIRLIAATAWGLFSCVAAAQNSVTALQYGNGAPQLVKFDPVGLGIGELVTELDLKYQDIIPNTSFTDPLNKRFFFFCGEKFPPMIVDVDLEGNGQSKEILLRSGASAPVFINKGNKLGFISSRTSFNGYQNNDNENTFEIMSLKTGQTTGTVPLNSISLEDVRAPFLGTGKTGDNQIQKVGLGSPAYNPDLNEVAFCALDITGTYRLFRIDVEAVKLKSSIALDHFVISLDYMPSEGKYAVLYLDETSRTIYAGVLNTRDGSLVPKSRIRSLYKSEKSVTDGQISFDTETSEAVVTVNQYYVSSSQGDILHQPEGVQSIYRLDAELQIENQYSSGSTQLKIDLRFPFAPDRTQQHTLESSISLYPNPATREFHLETGLYSLANEIKIYGIDRKLLQSYLILDGALEHKFSIEGLAPGMYFVRIETAGGQIVKKLLVQ